MVKFLQFIGDKLVSSQLDFRVRLFNVLAMAGTLVAFIIGCVTIITRQSFIIAFVDWASAAVAFGLLYYATQTQKYVRCYYITIFSIFLGLFPYLYFANGGYKGGMPAFFVFAVVFTAFMLEKKSAYVTLLLELAVFIGCFVVSYIHPHLARHFDDEFGYFINSFIDFVATSVALAVIALMHFSIYNRQQRELEKARSEAESANEAKSRFLANMSHEIRTPIGIMLGMNEVILRETNSGQIRGYSQSIENAGQQLLTLINNILDVSTIEKGRLEITEERYETAELISALSTAGESLARGRDLRFVTEADETLPRCLAGDMLHIRQIVTNFLSNAAKYTEQGGVMLSFSALPLKSADKITMQIAVIDTGIGIKAENIPHMFDAFTRGDTQGRYVEGSGLGLAIAKDYAERMGGRVFAESEPQHGSVFALELTQKVGDWEPMGNWEQAEFLPSSYRTNSFTAPDCDVLIVDDNNENLRLIKSLLSRTLMRTDTAVSGEKCLGMAAKRRYDVILMDYMMPGMDGEETLRRLKELTGFDTPVIALTANVVAGVREKLLDTGFYRYLSKPIRWRELENALLDVLPEERVTIGTVNEAEQVSAEVKEELTRELLSCGVELDEGLRYVGGDISQYGRLAVIFTENYDAVANAIRELVEENDWAGMKFRIHSLKGNARNLGANALSDTAAKLERLCVSGDGAYISAALPALYLEWERAKYGLTAFTERLSGILPAPEREKGPAPELCELLDMIKFNQFQNAMDALNLLIEKVGASEKAEKLREIRQKTGELKFREAEHLLTALMESEAG